MTVFISAFPNMYDVDGSGQLATRAVTRSSHRRGPISMYDNDDIEELFERMQRARAPEALPQNQLSEYNSPGIAQRQSEAVVTLQPMPRRSNTDAESETQSTQSNTSDPINLVSVPDEPPPPYSLEPSGESSTTVEPPGELIIERPNYLKVQCTKRQWSQQKKHSPNIFGPKRKLKGL